MNRWSRPAASWHALQSGSCVLQRTSRPKACGRFSSMTVRVGHGINLQIAVHTYASNDRQAVEERREAVLLAVRHLTNRHLCAESREGVADQPIALIVFHGMDRSFGEREKFRSLVSINPVVASHRPVSSSSDRLPYFAPLAILMEQGSLLRVCASNFRSFARGKGDVAALLARDIAIPAMRNCRGRLRLHVEKYAQASPRIESVLLNIFEFGKNFSGLCCPQMHIWRPIPRSSYQNERAWHPPFLSLRGPRRSLPSAFLSFPDPTIELSIPLHTSADSRPGTSFNATDRVRPVSP